MLCFSIPTRLETLAVIHALLGEPDAAIDQLEYLLSIPSRFSVEMLRLDPLWDPLRNHSRFKKLVKMNGLARSNCNAAYPR